MLVSGLPKREVPLIPPEPTPKISHYIYLTCTYYALRHNCTCTLQQLIFILESCSVQEAMRLIGGQNKLEGRVEFCFGGVWGTVCDDFWGSSDAQVVCSQLGYNTAGMLGQWLHYILIIMLLFFLKIYAFVGALAFSTAYFGQGAGPILLDNVLCAGNESSLLECNHIFNQSNCAHTADAGVRCQREWTCRYMYTVEPVYPDPGKCGQLRKMDTKPWSRIASHLPWIALNCTTIVQPDDAWLVINYWLHSLIMRSLIGPPN